MKCREAFAIFSDLLVNTGYISAYYHRPLKERWILIESKNGGDLAGNMFQILLELTGEQYREYTVFLSCTKKKREQILNRVREYNITGVHMVNVNTRRYYKILATAKYLFTDTSFPRQYVKKEGQIITNTWHGTPLKFMGVDVKNRIYAMGNVQRNLLFSDYLVFPNEYMKEIMVRSYQLQNLYQGTILCEGYPRNSCFFHADYGKRIRNELSLGEKQVSVYLPTWRGTLTKKTSDLLLLMMEYYLIPLDSMMEENQVLYVKLHSFVSKTMDFSRYRHIRKFPEQYDTYEFLNMSDVLITDYSSVFFDYANTGKKIILFAYDESQYMKERGLYLRPEELPFPVVKTAARLYSEMKSPKAYDDAEFRKRFCTYDGIGAAERICRHVIKNEKCCKEERMTANGKKNILIYSTGLSKNGITTALLGLLRKLEKDKYNYYISLTEDLMKADPERILLIPEGIGFLPIASDIAPSFSEMICNSFFYKSYRYPGLLRGLMKNRFTERRKDRMYRREFEKHYAGVPIDCVIQYRGYGINYISLMEAFPGKKVIFVHNNMVEELKNKDNQNPVSLKEAYKRYDRVAVVTEDIIPSTLSIYDCSDRLVQVSNCHDYDDVFRRAEKPVQLDKDTNAYISQNGLVRLLESEIKKFITIGRFSAEKGHDLLISAFARLNKEYPDSCLIIIGGYGRLYKKTVWQAKQSKAHIVVIRSMKNPMPVLKQSDYFVLSSRYEGLGLTLLEAATLGLPIISTDIPGPRGFMQTYGGRLVSPDEDGIYQGMKDMIEGRVKPLEIDFEDYNRHAVEQFEFMLENLLSSDDIVGRGTTQ